MFNVRMRAAQPTDPVQTVRLVLTPVGAEDVDDLIRLHGDPIVALWTGPWSRATTEAWTTDMAERWTADGRRNAYSRPIRIQDHDLRLQY